MHAALMILLPTIASFVAAWWGGILGVRREAKKLQQTHAFERRLDWYIEATRALARVQIQQLEYQRALAESREAAARFRDSMPVDELRNFSVLLQQSLIFARRATTRDIDNLREKMNRVMARKLDGSTSDMESSKEVTNALAKAFQDLAREARDHLGGEKLRPEDLASEGANVIT